MDKDPSSGLSMDALMGRNGPSGQTRIGYRAKSLRNLLKMGHCAPTVMKTIRDICGSEDEWLVKAAAGLPGGIGDTGFECGGITSPLMLFGLHLGLKDLQDGLPLIFSVGHDHIRRFVDRNGTPMCRDIRGVNYRVTRCMRAVSTSPEIAASALAGAGAGALGGEQRKAYALLYAHMAAEGFHCSRQVLQRLSPVLPPSRGLLDAASGFLGGTLFKGMTCGAYAAGVMAIGLGLGEIEDSLPRVARMVVLLKTGGNAFADPINKFNRSMNLGKGLGGWFTGEFGSTQCRAVTGCDFSSPAAVRRFIETGGLDRCRGVAEQVAGKVRGLLPDPQAA